MKLPLLLHASPKIDFGPTVMLSAGKWKIISNQVDSELTLLNLPIADNYTVDFLMDTPVFVQIHKHGTEKELTIFAVKD